MLATSAIVLATMTIGSTAFAQNIFALVPKNMNNPFFDQARDGCKKAEEESGGKFTCEYIGPGEHGGGDEQVQIVQETVTHLLVRMVRDPIFDAESERQVRQLVLDTFGPTMRYDLEFVDGIPQEPSGKYRFCVSMVAAEFVRGLSA